MTTVAIIQARMGSARLPGKVMKPILGQSMLSLLVGRVGKTKQVDRIVVATSVSQKDDLIADEVGKIPDLICFRGSEEDVLTRYYEAAVSSQADIILRVTADNPFFHAPTADKLIGLVQQEADYAANSLERTFPYGIDLEAFTFTALSKAYFGAKTPFQREHVTPYIRDNQDMFVIRGLQWKVDCSSLRLTVDTLDDYERAKAIFERYGQAVEFTDLLLA